MPPKNNQIYKYLLLFLSVFTGFSCTKQTSLEKDEYWLQGQSFKGNKEFSSDELELLIPANQKPNRRLFSLPITPAVWWYSFGKSVYNSPQKDKKYTKLFNKLSNLPSDSTFYDVQTARKKIRLKEKLSKLQETRDAKIAWFWRNIGEPPSKISITNINKTSKNIQSFMVTKGFIDAQINHKIDTLINGKVNLTYIINENQAYKIDSVFYDFSISQIDSVIQTNKKDALVKPKDKFDKNKILGERIRLETLLKNNGFYLFDKQLISIQTLKSETEFKKMKSSNIKFALKEIDKPELQRFRIKEIEFTAINGNSTSKISEIDTSVKYFNGIKYIFIEKKFPVRLLDSKIPLRPENIYRQSDVIETQQQLSILDQFAFANTRFTGIGDGKLRAIIAAPTLEKYFVTGDITGNTVQDILGGGVSGTLRIRNLLRSFDNLEFGIKFALEGQPSTLNLTNQLSREYGGNIALNIPQLILPYSIARKYALKHPRTQFNIGVNYSSQIYRETLNFRFNGNYSWRKSIYETIQISPIDMNLINTPYKSQDFLDALAQEPSLAILYKAQFLSSFNAFYVYNNQVLGQNTKAKYLRIFAESGGTLLNFFTEKNKINFLDNLIAVGGDSVRSYYRFWKVNLDFRKYIPIQANSSIAYRLNLGVGQSYGNISTLPYQKSFFAGGSNSLRAWSPRSLGPGSSQPNYFTSNNNVGQYLPQPGDIIMEGSLEYRGRLGRFLVGNMNYGVFLDAGNVWTWYQSSNKIDRANFDFTRFYKEFAVGTGFGFRWDLSYFIFRYDLGIKVFDPSQPAGQRFVLGRFNFSDSANAYYRLQSNFAIGMPF